MKIDLEQLLISCHFFSPPLSGTLVNSIGFEWMLVGMAVICFCYAPLLLLLKAPPTREEKKVGIDNGGLVPDALPASDGPHYSQETLDTKL